MKSHEPLTYTETEIKSVLPTGWSLTRDGAGAWDSKKKVWQLRILDNVEFDWPVVVKAEDVGALGRFEALRRAMDVVFRERLG